MHLAKNRQSQVYDNGDIFLQLLSVVDKILLVAQKNYVASDDICCYESKMATKIKRVE